MNTEISVVTEPLIINVYPKPVGNKEIMRAMTGMKSTIAEMLQSSIHQEDSQLIISCYSKLYLSHGVILFRYSFPFARVAIFLKLCCSPLHFVVD